MYCQYGIRSYTAILLLVFGAYDTVNDINPALR